MWDNRVPVQVTYATVCARGVIHVNPVWAVMGIEVLASVLVVAAASTHGDKN